MAAPVYEVWALDGRLATGASAYNATRLQNLGVFTQARNRKLSVVLNRSGTFSCSMPLDHSETSALRTSTPYLGAVEVFKNKTSIWSGFLQNIDDDFVSGTRNLTYVGWGELLRKRFISTATTLSDDISNIASAAISSTNANWYTGIVLGSAFQVGLTVSRTLNPGDNIADLLQQMSDVENGYDYQFYIQRDPFLQPLAPIIEYLIIPKTGSSKPNAIFELGRNVLAMNRSYDGTALANFVQVNGSSSVAPGAAWEQQSLETYGLLQDWITLGDVNSNDVLNAYANVEVMLRRNGKAMWQLTPVPSDGSGRVPEPFINYGLGDIIYVTAKRGAFNEQKIALRVFGYDIEIGDDGSERVTNFQVSPEPPPSPDPVLPPPPPPGVTYWTLDSASYSQLDTTTILG